MVRNAGSLVRRTALVLGVLIGGFASGTVLGAAAIYTLQWVMSPEPLMAEPLVRSTVGQSALADFAHRA